MTVANEAVQRRKRDYLWVVLFVIIFFNGFESGGYQASLWSIGQNYDLTTTSMGLFAAVELLADMLAPLLLGSWADRTGKAWSMSVLLAVQLVSTVVVWASQAQAVFLVGIFILGLTTSGLQFIAIATIADAYPASGKRKIGYITSMYAFGAVISPLVVSFYLGCGFGWRTLFILLAIGTLAAFVGIRASGADVREQLPDDQAGQFSPTRFMLAAILLLCVVMCVYVGFENGFAFFVDTMFTDVFNVSTGKFALSLYWAVMIPSRILVGRFSGRSFEILLVSIIAIPCITVLFAMSDDSTVALLLCIPLGLASGAIYPCVLNIALPLAGRKTATATGMITAATGIGGFALTALTGLMADQWGMRVAVMVLAAFFVFSLAAAIAVRFLAWGAPVADDELEGPGSSA